MLDLKGTGMQTLTDLLNSIPTNDCPDRLMAKDDLRYAIAIDSETVIENFINPWVLTPESDLAKMSAEDKAYRQFILEFQEKYHDHRKL